MEQTFEERLDGVSVDADEFKTKVKEKFEETIQNLGRDEFKILTRYKIENRRSVGLIAAITGLSAALVVLGGAAGAILPSPFGEYARLAVCLEVPGFLMANLKLVGEIIENCLLSAFTRRDLKREGIKFRWSGLDIRLKQDGEYIKFDNSENVASVKQDLKNEEEQRKWDEAMGRD